MTAKITVPAHYDFEKILSLAGVDPSDFDMHYYKFGEFFVKNISQDVLNNALSEYLSTNLVDTELDIKKMQAKKEIDAKAGKVRSKYITTTEGQAEVYLLKAADAEAFIAANYPSNIDDYPFIKAESIAVNKTPQQAANDIVSTRNAWKILGSTIEFERIYAKYNIDQSTSVEMIDIAKQNAFIRMDVL